MVAGHELGESTEQPQQTDLHLEDSTVLLLQELLTDLSLHFRDESILRLHQSAVNLPGHICKEVTI